jgi:pyridoxal 5'-phosphate synthase pdxS subunit
VLTPADEENHINKHAFKTPFVCGCRNLGEALRRIAEVRLPRPLSPKK